MSKVWLHKSCPRCGGRLHLEDYEKRPNAECYLCNRKFDLDTLESIRPPDPWIIEEQIRQENLRDWREK